jgi:hypothetical protein
MSGLLRAPGFGSSSTFPRPADLTENKGLLGSIVSRDYGYPTPGYKYIWFYADAP